MIIFSSSLSSWTVSIKLLLTLFFYSKNQFLSSFYHTGNNFCFTLTKVEVMFEQFNDLHWPLKSPFHYIWESILGKKKIFLAYKKKIWLFSQILRYLLWWRMLFEICLVNSCSVLHIVILDIFYWACIIRSNPTFVVT